MKWIGLTGGIATGKSTAAKSLREMGFEVIDADQLAREVVAPNSPGLKLVAQAFGPAIIDSSGNLDRTKMASIVFSNPEARMKLESILHPLIHDLALLRRKELERKGSEVAFYDVPLLFEKKMEDEFDAVIVIYANREIQKSRLVARNQLTSEEIEKRLSAQMDLKLKVKKADIAIENNLGILELKKKLGEGLQKIGLLPSPGIPN